MRFLLAAVISVFALHSLSAQIVINEIMYNPPESGSDSLEYIELYNAGSAVNLEGYTFTQGVDFTFPDFEFAADDYLIVCIDSMALNTVLGIEGAFTWESGALSNGGEDIILEDPQGNTVDVIDYQNGGEWPTDANGNGASIELCSPLADNTQGNNWKASTSAKGIVINGSEIRATPDAENNVSCANYSVEVRNNVFDPDTLVINVGETVEWVCVEGFHNVNGSTTTYPNNPEGFTSGAPEQAPWTFSHTFNVEGNYDYQCDPHQLLGMVGYIQVVNNPVADIVITEIMYNDPGSDTTEFVELYNNSTEEVNLEGYQFINGIDVTFGAVTMASESYLVVAAHPSYIKDSFGIDAIEYTGSLNNAGETIELVDNQGRSVDRVTYDNSSPWDPNADGLGYSLILCDVDADNASGLNWSVSTNETPIIIERRVIFCSPGAADTCEVPEERYPRYDIATVSTVDALGFPDSNNVTCTVQGIVHGIDLQGGNAIQFTLIDNTGGIGVFSSENFNYTVQEGDELQLKGTIAAFSGLTQINPDSLKVISMGNALQMSTFVTELNEDTESELVTLSEVNFVNPNDWRGDGSSFNIEVTDGVNFYDLRIDDDTEMANHPIFPSGPYNITGIGGQFDRSEPFDEGYQLLPRYDLDFELVLSSEDILLEGLSVTPNPIGDQLIIQGMTPGMSYDVFDVNGKRVASNLTKSVQAWNHPQGVYYLRMKLDRAVRVLKVIKQ